MNTWAGLSERSIGAQTAPMRWGVENEYPLTRVLILNLLPENGVFWYILWLVLKFIGQVKADS